MVLSDTEIRAALANGQLGITPAPVQISSTAVDLTLGGREFRRWKPIPKGQRFGVDPSVPRFTDGLQGLLEDVPREQDGAVVIEPFKFILALTRETVSLPKPSRIAARVEGKSSLARIGLAVHVTAPTIHAGWEGEIALEIVNFGEYRIHLCPGMAICQLIVEQVYGTPTTQEESRFQRQGSVLP